MHMRWEPESVCVPRDLALMPIPKNPILVSDDKIAPVIPRLLFVRRLCDLIESRVFVEAEVYELGRVALTDGRRSV